MARVLGNPVGEIRGKLGGAVFSRNKSGAIVRQYVVGTNRNSQRQHDVRQSFGAVSKAFSGLTPAEKAEWNLFAKDAQRFQPLQGSNEGQFSGYNAFMALRQVTMQHLEKYQMKLITFTGFDVKEDPLILPYHPPLSSMKGDIMLPIDSNPESFPSPISLSLSSCSADSSKVSFTVRLSQPGYFKSDSIELIDSSLNRFGFGLYMSSPISAVGIRPKIFLYQKIVSTGILSLEKDVAGFVDSIDLSVTVDFAQYADILSGPKIFTLYQQGEFGHVKNLGSVSGLLDLSS